MKCPHCLISYFEKSETSPIGEDGTSRWSLRKDKCPNCEKFILGFHEEYDRFKRGHANFYNFNRLHLCYPKSFSRSPLGKNVPEAFSTDYKEACLVLSDSPKASAALSRRCLQHLLREVAKVKPSDLYFEIQEVINSKTLPPTLSDSLDAVRHIGNFGAHPIKSKSSGEIIDVETGEAEWNLDVLEALFNYYFIQPAEIKKKKDALNAKLKEAGKPELK